MNKTFQILPTSLTVLLAAMLAGCATTTAMGPAAQAPEVMKPAAAAPVAPAPAVAPSAAVAPVAPPPGPLLPIASAQEYIVKPGDTGAKIARNQGIAVSELMALNPGVQWSKLRIGQKIRVRAAN